MTALAIIRNYPKSTFVLLGVPLYGVGFFFGDFLFSGFLAREVQSHLTTYSEEILGYYGLLPILLISFAVRIVSATALQILLAVFIEELSDFNTNRFLPKIVWGSIFVNGSIGLVGFGSLIYGLITPTEAYVLGLLLEAIGHTFLARFIWRF